MKQLNEPKPTFDKDAPPSENTCYCCGEDIESAHVIMFTFFFYFPNLTSFFF